MTYSVLPRERNEEGMQSPSVEKVFKSNVLADGVLAQEDKYHRALISKKSFVCAHTCVCVCVC